MASRRRPFGRFYPAKRSQKIFLSCGDSDCHIISDNIGSDEFYRVAPVADLEKMRDDELRKKGIYTIMKEQLEK